MNNSRTKGRKGKPQKQPLLPSQLLELEAEKREKELIELRKKIREDQQLKFKQQSQSNGNHWRSATKNKKLHGYSDMVREHYQNESNPSYSNPQSAQVKKRVNSKQSEGRIMPKGLNIKNSGSKPLQNSSIESNFNKALQDQNNDYSEVSSFLGQIKMDKYKEVFIDNGIEDHETILELKEEHLEQMHLPLGHKLKIMKRIKDLNKQAAPKVSQVSQASAVSAGSSTASAAATEPVAQSDNLLDGVYDEEANKKEFQAALDAWRNAGKKESSLKQPSSAASSKGKVKKNVRFAEAAPEEVLILNNDEPEEDEEAKVIPSSKPGPTTEIKEGMIAFKGLSVTKNSFLYSEEASGSNDWNLNLLSTVDHAETSPMEEVPLRTPPPKVEKELWIHCFKYFNKSEGVHDSLTGKTFKSFECQAEYFHKNVGRWSNKEWDKYFLKKSGMIVHKEWYWSPEWGQKGYEVLNRPEPEAEPEQEEIDISEPVVEVDLSDV